MNYVHGYSSREARRLDDQAGSLIEIIHGGLRYASGRRVLEPGCGTGSQTLTLTANSPRAHFTSVDRSADSLEIAQARVRSAGLENVSFELRDILAMPYEDQSFDDLFVCFLLEHIAEPVAALKQLSKMIRPDGTVTVVEGDHGSWYAYPHSEEAQRAVDCLIEVQRRAGGDGLIGRSLYPLMMQAGLRNVRVEPKMVYVDSSRPDLVEAFSKNTFIAMVEGVRETALSLGLITEEQWKKGIADLYRATERDGTFCYTFFRGTALV